MPPLARRLLWTAGLGLDALAILALFADTDPDGSRNRVVGAIVIAAVGSLAIVAVVTSARRPPVARLLGMAAAAGMLFVAWIVLTRPGSSWFTILVGLVLLAVGGIVGWQLFRWRPDRGSSGETEDRANLA